MSVSDEELQQKREQSAENVDTIADLKRQIAQVENEKEAGVKDDLLTQQLKAQDAEIARLRATLSQAKGEDSAPPPAQDNSQTPASVPENAAAQIGDQRNPTNFSGTPAADSDAKE